MNPPNQPRIKVMRIIARMNVGGPAVQVSGLMRGFNKKDFDHRLFTGFCGANEADYLDSVALDVKALRIEGLGRRVSLRKDFKSFLSLVREIQIFKPDIIHTHTAKAGFLGRIASIVSFHSSIRVHTFHGHLLVGYFSTVIRRLVIITERVLAIFTHQLLAVGEKVREDLIAERIGNHAKFGLMPPGLEVGQLPTKSVAREFLGLSLTSLQCAFIGRVTKVKRPDRFLDVVDEIKKRHIDIEFFMAGDGEILNDCRKRIVGNELPVKVLGWQNNIEKILAAADIVILTSDNEGMPLSLIQAGMAALPVVTTKVGSVPEIVLDGKTGFITSFDIQEIADALEKLSQDAGLRSGMGSAAQDFTLANFGVNRLVRDHEELYKRLMANRANA